MRKPEVITQHSTISQDSIRQTIWVICSLKMSCDLWHMVTWFWWKGHMLKSTAIAALRLCSCTAGAMMLTLERCGICRPWSSMDHYYIDLHPYSALVQFFEVQEEGVGVGKWRLQEAKLTVLLNLAELQRLQAVLAAAVLLREAGAPSCRGFILFRNIVHSSLGARLVHLVVSWISHATTHVDDFWILLGLDTLLRSCQSYLNWNWPRPTFPATSNESDHFAIPSDTTIWGALLQLHHFSFDTLSKSQTLPNKNRINRMMVPHRAMLHSNRSCCIGNLDKALLHPLTRETIVKDHIWISKIQHVMGLCGYFSVPGPCWGPKESKAKTVHNSQWCAVRSKFFAHRYCRDMAQRRTGWGTRSIGAQFSSLLLSVWFALCPCYVDLQPGLAAVL